MKKGLLAFFLMLVIVVSCFALDVFAAESTDNDLSSESAQIYVESTYCVIGKTVEVDIYIQNNPGIAGAKFNVAFDEKLTLLAATEDGGVFESLDYTAPNALVNLCPFNWDSFDAVAAEDGKIMTLTFAVSEDVVAGEKLDVTLTYKYGDIYDVNLNSIAVSMVGGSLSVIDYTPGDVDGDGTVNGIDVTLIRRYNANWDVEINELAADVNADGAINGKDVTQIRRFNADWDVKLAPGKAICEHHVIAINAKTPTCTEAGNIAYWQCEQCHTCFTDAEATNEILFSDTVISAKGHALITNEAILSTCTEAGNIAYWQCEQCHTCFTDAEATNEILFSDTVIPSAPSDSHRIGNPLLLPL